MLAFTPRQQAAGLPNQLAFALTSGFWPDASADNRNPREFP
jgi:hypothetical protein